MDFCRIYEVLIVLTYAILLVLSQQVGFKEIFQCRNCTTRSCPALKQGCEIVMEPGVCACCMACARMEGQTCGLTTGRCGRGLSCRPPHGDPDPIMALVVGRGVCVSNTYLRRRS
ncbi:hypothetical protein DPMN_014446 [Dreissena polymorpha]|uniref:IGFBP N-terminal domain-containing protein n=1 Tax=Dreissena polymorpha TaxID=45954 RepID=A0A9D4NBQ8_DREPO|nr:hypothetical protein DPMN_014446 [Dreissena polymorpha]